MATTPDSPGASPNAPPQTLGHYVIEGELGRGGMGVVFLARDRKLDRLVAIKTLPVELARDPDARKRFLNEGRAAATLGHPNAAVLYEVGTEGEDLFLAMGQARRFASGPDSRSRIEPKSRSLDGGAIDRVVSHDQHPGRLDRCWGFGFRSHAQRPSF